MGAGSVESTGRCLEHQTPSEGRAGGGAGCQQPLPHIPGWKVLGEGTGQVGARWGQRVGESHQDTALQGTGGEGALQGLAPVHRCRWPGETSLHERLKGKFII